MKNKDILFFIVVALLCVGPLFAEKTFTEGPHIVLNGKDAIILGCYKRKVQSLYEVGWDRLCQEYTHVRLFNSKGEMTEVKAEVFQDRIYDLLTK